MEDKMQLEQRRSYTETEQTGKPTYHSYSSIPIEQESGPRAGNQDPKWGSTNGRVDR